MGRKLSRKIFIMLVLFIIFHANGAGASAWTRKNNELFMIFEILNESNYSDTLFKNKSVNFYRTNSYKLYGEYGITDKITIGGYLKNFNFSSKYYYRGIEFTDKVKNDYYGNIFAIQNLYNRNLNLFSLKYSFYFPIVYDDISENVNTVDTKYGFELSTLFGKDGSIDFENTKLNYYIDMGLGYKLLNDMDYDQITFYTTIGFRLNQLSSFNIMYEHKSYLTSNLFQKYRTVFNYYDGSDSDKIELAVNYGFLDDLSVQMAYYRSFSTKNSTGIIFSLIFDKF